MSEIVQPLRFVFCALHDQLASLGRHAQLTRCLSAVAELLVCFSGEPMNKYESTIDQELAGAAAWESADASLLLTKWQHFSV